MHHATGLYAHITWHTKWRKPCIGRDQVRTIATAITDAAERTRLRVHEQAVLADHVHVLVSFPPDATISAFVRDAKSESSRRAKVPWCRGFYAGTVGRKQVRAVRVYIGGQHRRHPHLVPE